jgi:hypothetical protein
MKLDSRRAWIAAGFGADAPRAELARGFGLADFAGGLAACLAGGFPAGFVAAFPGVFFVTCREVADVGARLRPRVFLAAMVFPPRGGRVI